MPEVKFLIVGSAAGESLTRLPPCVLYRMRTNYSEPNDANSFPVLVTSRGQLPLRRKKVRLSGQLVFGSAESDVERYSQRKLSALLLARSSLVVGAAATTARVIVGSGS